MYLRLSWAGVKQAHDSPELCRTPEQSPEFLLMHSQAISGSQAGENFITGLT